MLIVATYSEFMRSMFYADGKSTKGKWKESSGNPVELPQCNEVAFAQFVQYCYSGKLHIFESSVCSLIELLDFLGVRPTVVENCCNWAKSHIDLATVCEYLVFAKRLRHQVQSLYDACMQWIEVNAVEAMEWGILDEVPIEELVALAQSRHLCANEIHLFEALRKRHLTTIEESPPCLPFEHVQLAMMTLYQLSGPVKDSGIYDLQTISEVTFGLLQGEFNCDSEQLRIPRNPRWQWKLPPNFSNTYSTELLERGTCLHFKNQVTKASVPEFSASSCFNSPRCLKCSYLVAFFNTTPSLSMTLSFSVRMQTTPSAHARPVSIEIRNQVVSVRDSPTSVTSFTCPVKRNFLFGIYQGQSAFYIEINGYRSAVVRARRRTVVKFQVKQCEPGLKLCILPIWR